MSSRDDTSSVRPQPSGEREEMVEVSTFATPGEKCGEFQLCPEGIFILIGTLHIISPAAALPACIARSSQLFYNQPTRPTITSKTTARLQGRRLGMFRHGETCSTGQSSLPAEMVGVALSFLDGRSLTSFEVASRGTRLAMQGHPNLFKALLMIHMANVPQMAPVSTKEGRRALIAWDGGDFQPVQARSAQVAPAPRYLHRVALADDGWYYLFGGHRQLDVVGDVWRFRVEKPRGRRTRRAFSPVSVRWEPVDGVASTSDGVPDGDRDGGAGDGAGDGGSATESDSDRSDDEIEEESSDADGGALPPPVVATPIPLPDVNAFPFLVPMIAEAQAAGLPGVGWAEIQELFFEETPLPADFDANGKPARPRPRCAASWTAIPGSNKIYLYGGHGSGNDFLDDLWCFHAGGRGECRWEKLEAEGGLRPRHSKRREEKKEVLAIHRYPVPDGRWGHTMVEHRGVLYMFGGSSPGHAYAGLWRLDTSVSPCVWSPLGPEGEKPPPRGGHSATVVGDTLYVFGGNITTSVFNDLWAVDLPCGRFWRQIPIASNFPLPRIGHSAVAMGNRILIYGGRNFKTDKYIPGLSCFDTDLQAFVHFPHAEAFSKRATRREGMWPSLAMTGHAAVPFGRGLLMVGGMVPRDHCTMTPWVLDVVSGRRRGGKASPRKSRVTAATTGCGTS